MTLTTRTDRLLAEVEEMTAKHGAAARNAARRERNIDSLVRRFDAIDDEAMALLSPADRRRVEAACEGLEEDGHERGPYNRWVDDWWRGRCRIPADLTAETLAKLLVSWLDPAIATCLDPTRPHPMTCSSCGLLFVTAHFPSCPHCGADSRRANWPHLTDNMDLPWKGLPGSILEGVMA